MPDMDLSENEHPGKASPTLLVMECPCKHSVPWESEKVRDLDLFARF